MTDIATCVLIDGEGRVLILKRSSEVWTYKRQWGAVAGYIESDEAPIETAFKEIREEVGLEKEDVTLVKELDIIDFNDVYEDKNFHWIIHPFLFKTEKKDKVQIDWEHTEFRWIWPKDITRYHTVPHLVDIVKKASKMK